jgi:hypothetical protein
MAMYDGRWHLEAFLEAPPLIPSSSDTDAELKCGCYMLADEKTSDYRKRG